VKPENIEAQLARNAAGPTVRAPVIPTVPKLPPGATAVNQIAPQGLEVTGFRATPSIPANTPTLAEMTGMANLQAPRGLLGETPLTTTVPNAEGLLSKELSAAQETAARSQRGLTKAQLAYRASLFEGKPVTGSYANLVSELEDAATTALRRKQIIAEFRRRGIVNKYTQ